jgi:hypothetical protein
MMMDNLPPGFSQWVDIVRRETEVKAEQVAVLKELRRAHETDAPRHKEIVGLLNSLIRLAEANYTTNHAIYTLLAQMCGVEVTESNKMRKRLEADAIERGAKELRNRLDTKISISGDGNIVGDHSTGDTRKEDG